MTQSCTLVCSPRRRSWGNSVFASEIISANWSGPVTSTQSTEQGSKVKFWRPSLGQKLAVVKKRVPFWTSYPHQSSSHKWLERGSVSWPLFNNIYFGLCWSFLLFRYKCSWQEVDIYFGPNSTNLNLISKILVKQREKKISPSDTWPAYLLGNLITKVLKSNRWIQHF